jgi:DNA-binding NarL/FixJ family response regulator
VSTVAPVEDRDPPPEPTHPELELLALLARGMTDAAVRSRLGLSRRTFERMLRSVFDKLGARSRLEAGFLLATAGWLKPEP